MIGLDGWIATPGLPPDFRGPVHVPFTPSFDPATAPPMIELLRIAASAAPDAPVAEDETGCLSYGQFLRAVLGLAGVLAASGAQGDRVGLLMKPCLGYLVGVFACAAIGRVAVLLDTTYPAARTADLIARTGISAMLVADGSSWPGTPCHDVTPFLQGAPPHSGLPPPVPLDAPAFILCTSGSTGRPKAVVHSQRTLLHWVRTMHDAMHLTRADRALSLSSPSTLGGINPMLCFPLCGASVQLLDIKAAGLRDVLDVLATRPVTILRATPSLLRSLATVPDFAAAASRLRIVQVHGEPFTHADFAALRPSLPPNCFVRSTYGSTEASGIAWFAGPPDAYDPHRVATGVLMPDTQAAILDEEGRPCPPGEAGDLLIASRYNALGVWQDGQLVPGDVGDPARRVFRTGDVARYHPDGVFVVLGRSDRMVKVNGQRLEPTEVEAVLRRHEDVVRAEVVLRRRAARPILVAFVVARAGAPPALTEALAAELRRSLPLFMVPSRIVLLPSMPMLPGDKVDLQALSTVPI